MLSLTFFGIKCLQKLIIENGEKILKKILSGIEKATQMDNKIMIVKKSFSRSAYNLLKDKEIAKLSDTVKDLFQVIDAFGKLHNV